MIHQVLRRAMARVRVSWLSSVVLLTVGCHAERVVAPVDVDVIDGPDAFTTDVSRALSIPTYDGSAQTVHPDLAKAPSWFPHHGWFLAITPYPNGDVMKENPSLFVASDPLHWSPPAGAKNPVVLTKTRGAYLSDPDIVFNPEAKELWLYYREFDHNNVVKLARTTDGVVWSEAETVVDAPYVTAVSPSIVRRGPAAWEMWTVDAGQLGCSSSSTSVTLRRSMDGRHWSDPTAVNLDAPLQGFFPWHIDVQWIPTRNEYWAVYNAKIPSNCATTVLFFATSPDGVNWTTRPIPLLLAGEIPELWTIVYRSTFAYNAANDVVTFWFSGATRATPASSIVWSTVMRRTKRADLYARTAGEPLGALRIPKPIRLPNPP